MERKPQILFVQHAGSGGAAVSLSQIVRKLVGQGFEARVLLLRADARAVELLERNGAQVIAAPGLSQFRQVVGGWSLATPLGLAFSLRSLLMLGPSLVQFRRLLARLQPDLVYLNALPACLYACPAKRAGIPAILHVREIVEDGPGGIWRKLYAAIIRRCVTQTIYIGAYEKARLQALGPAEVVPNYVDLRVWNREQSRPGERAVEAAVPPGPAPVILFVGGLNPIKGLRVLLPALARLRQRAVPFRCVCLALDTGARRPRGLKRFLLSAEEVMSFEEVHAFVEQNDLIEQIEFKPYTNNPVAEYAQADILVFPSTAPHFPRPLVEAGALGLPVVASDLPGPRAVVEPGINGLLVPANDANALADALERLLVDSRLRATMGEANYQVVKEHHNAAMNEQCILRLIETYIHVS
jgi:glycosyltransferase involved in cell wall biosynthesis